jgi:hypothetical protein
MKKGLIYLGSITLVIIILFACGGASNDENADAKKKQELEAQKEEAKLEKQKLDSINKALSAIKVRVFNHEALAFDSEGWCIMEDNSVRINEVKDFNSTKTYSCKEGNYIQKLSIEGDFKGITIQFLDDKAKLVKEFKNVDLKKSISYSDVNYQPVSQQEVKKKDAFYQDWFEKASKIQMAYNDSIFYTATWKSNGWYVQ